MFALILEKLCSLFPRNGIPVFAILSPKFLRNFPGNFRKVLAFSLPGMDFHDLFFQLRGEVGAEERRRRPGHVIAGVMGLHSGCNLTFFAGKVKKYLIGNPMSFPKIFNCQWGGSFFSGWNTH